MPRGMCRLLHRAFDFIDDPRHAARQTGGHFLRSARLGFALQIVQRPAPAGCLQKPASIARNVREQPRRGDTVSKPS